jgi:hypothetical protein
MKSYLIFCLIALMASGCNSDKTFKNENADTTSANMENPDTVIVKKIIKTADMRFRVKDVQFTKERLSSVVKAEGGSIAEFNVQSSIQETEKAKYSTDSLLELTSYRTEGSVVAKVPSDKLDEFTNKIAKLAVFIDSQSMKAEDQGARYLSNELKNKNKVEAVVQFRKHATRKNNNVATALTIKDNFVDNEIENLLLDTQVKFSTITLNFYQDNTVTQVVVGNDNLSDYRPDFFKRLGLSFINGWVIFKEFLLVITNLWIWILISVTGYYIFKYYRRKKTLTT